jgi:anti-sigma28 factor (negative regulator of flagellin synthesis)
MKITGNKSFEPIRPESVKPAAGATTSPASPASAPRRNDQVQISDAGRALAGELQGSEASSSLSAERTAELRRKVLEGAYNSMSVVDQVAQRILSRGDI